MRRVLIVDDDPEMVQVLRMVFETAGYSVAASTDAACALDLANREPFDLVLMDWTLGGMAGEDLLAGLRGSSSGSVPVLVLSGSADARAAAAEAGANAFLLKPIQLDELLGAVDELLRRGAEVGSPAAHGEHSQKGGQ